jgi:hypothetical protein
MQKLHSKRVEKMQKLHSKRVENKYFNQVIDVLLNYVLLNFENWNLNIFIFDNFPGNFDD